MRRFFANFASLTKAMILVNWNADSSSLRKLKMVWSVRSFLFTQPDTRMVPSRLERAGIGSGALRYDWIFWAGLGSSSL